MSNRQLREVPLLAASLDARDAARYRNRREGEPVWCAAACVAEVVNRIKPDINDELAFDWRAKACVARTARHKYPYYCERLTLSS